MAESVVSFLLNHLSQLLEREAKLLYGVEDKIRSLHNELQLINVYIKFSSSAGKNSNNKQIEQEVLNQIRDVAHSAEDVIDTFVAKAAMHKRRSWFGRMLHVSDHVKLVHDVAEKIDQIKTSINEIHENKIKYDCTGDQENSDREEEERVKSIHRLRRNVEEEDVVGFFHESEGVINRLKEGGLKRGVISIIGMGGLGKTTLARKVYNSDQVKKLFPCRVWVYVSNECRAREILVGLLKQLMPNRAEYRRSSSSSKKDKEAIDKPGAAAGDYTTFSEDDLKETVRECLNLKKYLLVLDDLWKTQDWDEVQDAFPDVERGSKILITSRMKEVASHASSNPPHYLQFLTNEQSWELFSKKVFKGEECPSDLEPLGKQMVNSCGGLPLSIVVLAGLLANKEKSNREWSRVVGHVNWYLTRDETQVKDIVLKLSYENLATRLKPCFLYIGIFPEDFEIHVRQLIELWVAEGFIEETGSRDPDDIAEDYLYELIDRSLIQVARVKKNGGVKTCRIHDLLRDLCISKSKEDKVFHVCTDNNILFHAKPRRLSVNCNMSHYISLTSNDHSCVRSLFCYDPNWYPSKDELKWLSKDFNLVRVLDLGGECHGKIPSSLGNFIHLRYLKIDISYADSVSDAICNLHNLQTLDMLSPIKLTGFSFIYISYGILNLKHLRHVYTQRPIMFQGGRRSLESDGKVMWNLHTISIVIDKETSSLIEKGKFPKLRKLMLLILPNSQEDVPKLLLTLQQLRHLNELQIFFGKRGFLSPVEWICCTLQGLKHLNHLSVLKIYNAMNIATFAAPFLPPNITQLTLLGMTWNDDWINAIGKLTKLRILILGGHPFIESHFAFDLNCTTRSGFPQLQIFQMKELPARKWKLDNGAMPQLQTLVINDCYQLNSLPNELWSLDTLRKVHITRPSVALAVMLRNVEVKNGCELIVERK